VVKPSLLFRDLTLSKASRTQMTCPSPDGNHKHSNRSLIIFVRKWAKLIEVHMSNFMQTKIITENTMHEQEFFLHEHQ